MHIRHDYLIHSIMITFCTLAVFVSLKLKTMSVAPSYIRIDIKDLIVVNRAILRGIALDYELKKVY